MAGTYVEATNTDTRRTDLHLIVDKFNEQLPIEVTLSDIDQNLEFSKLLTLLTKKINADGTTRSIQQDVEEAFARLKRQKEKWLECQVVYTELKELLLDKQIDKQCGPTGQTTASAQFYEAVKEMLTHAEVADYVGGLTDTDSGATLLGLKVDDLQKTNRHAKHTQSIQQKLIPELESRLRERCEELVGFFELSSDTCATDSNQLMFAKVSQFPVLLEQELQTIEDERRQLKLDRKKRRRQFELYSQAIADCLQTLEELARHWLQHRPNADAISTQWLVTNCETSRLKLRVMELQLQTDMYNASTVDALEVIRSELERSTQTAHSDLSQASQALRAYESVGAELDAVVQQFTQLRDSIDNKRWALQELKEHLLTEDAGQKDVT